jgi:hypothetical protein
LIGCLPLKPVAMAILMAFYHPLQLGGRAGNPRDIHFAAGNP